MKRTIKSFRPRNYFESLPRLEEFATNIATELVRFVCLAMTKLVDATGFEAPEFLLAIRALVPQFI